MRRMANSGFSEFFSFLKISRVLERIRTENIDMKSSLDSKLHNQSICSIRILPGNGNI